jgi:hypothetical protein
MIAPKLITLALLIVVGIVAVVSPGSSASHPRIVCGKKATIPPYIVTPNCHVYPATRP